MATLPRRQSDLRGQYQKVFVRETLNDLPASV